MSWGDLTLGRSLRLSLLPGKGIPRKGIWIGSWGSLLQEVPQGTPQNLLGMGRGVWSLGQGSEVGDPTWGSERGPVSIGGGEAEPPMMWETPEICQMLLITATSYPIQGRIFYHHCKVLNLGAREIAWR